MIYYQEVFQLAKKKGYKCMFRTYVRAEFILLELTLIQKWLRDEHNIVIDIDSYDVSDDVERVKDEMWHYSVSVTSPQSRATHNDFVKEGYVTYEDGLLEGIYEALKLLP
jgi:hypothetical protein